MKRPMAPSLNQAPQIHRNDVRPGNKPDSRRKSHTLPDSSLARGNQGVSPRYRFIPLLNVSVGFPRLIA